MCIALERKARSTTELVKLSTFTTNALFIIRKVPAPFAALEGCFFLGMCRRVYHIFHSTRKSYPTCMSKANIWCKKNVKNFRLFVELGDVHQQFQVFWPLALQVRPFTTSFQYFFSKLFFESVSNNVSKFGGCFFQIFSSDLLRQGQYELVIEDNESERGPQAA